MAGQNNSSISDKEKREAARLVQFIWVFLIVGIVTQDLTAFARSLLFVDPLTVDMNGDGKISFTGPNAVYFDIDRDGMREAVSWVAPEDGLLVREVDGEVRLFGQAEAGSAFAELQALDLNHDGKLDAADAAYATLKVWQDFNQDGIAQAFFTP